MIAAKQTTVLDSVAHGLKHHLDKERLKLLGDLFNGFVRVGTRTTTKVRQGPHVVINGLRCAWVNHGDRSDHNQLGTHRPSLLECLEHRDHITGCRTHLIHRVDQLLKADAGAQYEHPRVFLFNSDV